jgi:hypothetical protein
MKHKPKTKPKIKPNPATVKRRDLYGDPKQGILFTEMIDNKFGTERGSRKTAFESLHLQRRIFNMYMTGERYIPDEVWSKLRAVPDYVAPARKTRPILYIDDVDPLS